MATRTARVLEAAMILQEMTTSELEAVELELRAELQERDRARKSQPAFVASFPYGVLIQNPDRLR